MIPIAVALVCGTDAQPTGELKLKFSKAALKGGMAGSPPSMMQRWRGSLGTVWYEMATDFTLRESP